MAKAQEQREPLGIVGTTPDNELILKWTNYPRQDPQPREKEMQVLCLGLSRTGTMSLYVALGKLGINTYHAAEANADALNRSMPLWTQAIDAKYFGKGKPWQPQDFEQMLWRYSGTTDIPSVLFVDELLAAYPNAKVVLTTRDADSWLRSVEASFYKILSWKRWKPMEIMDREHIHYYIPLLRNCLKIWSKGDWQNRDKLKQGFLDHNDYVRKVVPKERLLEFHPSMGWKPLCKHLGKPIPNEMFPKINEGSATADVHIPIFWGRVIRTTQVWAMYTLPVVIAVGLGLWYRFRRR